MNAEELIARLGLEPLEPEGGWWGQSYIDENGTGIYYLLTEGQCSLLHRLPGPEIYSECRQAVVSRDRLPPVSGLWSAPQWPQHSGWRTTYRASGPS